MFMKTALYILATVAVLSLIVFLITKSQTQKSQEQEKKKKFSLREIAELFKRANDEPAEVTEATA